MGSSYVFTNNVFFRIVVFAMAVSLGILSAIIAIPSLVAVVIAVLAIIAWRWPKIGFIIGGLLDISTFFHPAFTVSFGSLEIGLRPSNLLFLVVIVSPYTIAILRAHKGTPAKTRLIIAITVLACWTGFATILTPLLDPGFAPFYANSIKLYFRWLVCMLYLIVGLYMPWNEKEAVRFSFWIPLVITVVVITLLLSWGVHSPSDIFTLSRWEERFSGVAVSPNEIGQILTLFCVLALGRGLGSKAAREKLLMAGVALCLAVGVLCTFSRESYVSLGVAVIIIGLVARMRIWQRLSFVMGIFLIFIGLKDSPFGNYLLWTKETLADDPFRATSGRTDIWAAALSVGLRYPLTGVGFWGFEYFSGGVNTAAHNGFLQSFVMAGLPGLGAYLWFIYALYMYLKQAEGRVNLKLCPLVTSVRAFFLGFVLSGLVSDHFFGFPVLNVLFWIVVCVIGGTSNEERRAVYGRC